MSVQTSRANCPTVVLNCVTCNGFLETTADSPQVNEFVQFHDGVWIHPGIPIPRQRSNE